MLLAKFLVSKFVFPSIVFYPPLEPLMTLSDRTVKGWLREDDDDDDLSCWKGTKLQQDGGAHNRAILEQLVALCSEATGQVPNQND